MSNQKEEINSDIEKYLKEYLHDKSIITSAVALLNNLCTDEFLSDMFYNLEEVFGHDNVPYVFTDEFYEIDGESYQDVEIGKGPVFDFYSSTQGWFLAIRESFKNHPEHEKEYYAFYNAMDWMDSDVFDGAMEAYLDAWYRKNLSKLKKKCA